MDKMLNIYLEIILIVITLIVAIIYHELGHLLYLKYAGIPYKRIFELKGPGFIIPKNLTGTNKVYLLSAGIFAGLIPLLIWPRLITFFFYLIGCKDDLIKLARLVQWQE